MEHHPSYRKLQLILSKGIKYPLLPIDKELRMECLTHNLKYGNHPTHDTILEQKINDFILEELEKSFLLPIRLEKVSDLSQAEVCAIHIVKQLTIDEYSNESTKYYPCHNLSYNPYHLSKSLINDRIIEDEMYSIQYAFTIWHILYFVLALRLKYPSVSILLLKFDIDGAFKRIALYFLLAFKIIIILGTLAFISLCSTFGGKSSYSDFSLLTELMCNVMNKSLSSDRLSALHQPSFYTEYYDPPDIIHKSVPFTPALPLLFPIDTKRDRLVDLYIDDFIYMYLNKIRNEIYEATTCFNVIMNIFDLFFKRLSSPILNKLIRKCTLSLCKLSSEGTPAEIKKILDLIIDTQRLTMVLPIKKGTKQKQIIQKLISEKKCSTKDLEKLIGRLVRVLIICPRSFSFLRDLRATFYSAINGTAKLSLICIEDLTLQISIIKKCIKRIPIRQITLKMPSLILSTNISGSGIGRFNLYTG